ncbi:MAG: glycoside hydrolase family 127 protein [Ignavibacteriales bacterium]|nr:glycoside hydrolase family 127 protein [Ignavibacteriales bacterium]
MIRKILLLFTILLFSFCEDKINLKEYPIKAVEIDKVKINDAFWLPKIKLIQNKTINYSFNKCKVEGRMDNFLIAGGKLSGSTKGKMPFDDTDLYKIIEGASYSLISSPNPKLDAYIDSIISVIKVGQEEDGYLTTWFTIDREKPPATWVEPSKNRWENEISSHELYNSGHLFEAAAAHFWATGKENFLNIAIKNADLLVDNFSPKKLHSPPGHQIVETGLIKLYQITKNPKYIELSKFFIDLRGDSTTHKLYGEYSQDHLPVTEQKEAVGHAVRALYMYAGMTDIGVIYSDQNYLNAVNNIWENIVSKKMYITGGLGARHNGESFGDNYELPNLTAYNETCAAIGSVYWNHRLFLNSGNSKYYDIIERTLYNGLISGISLNGEDFFYPNPLESDGEYKFNQGSATRQPWFDCSCCPTNMIRFLPSIPKLIYAINKDTVYVNLFIANDSEITIDDEKVSISQETEYPWDGKVLIKINPHDSKNFTIKIRIPNWALNNVVPSDLYTYINKSERTIKVRFNGVEQTVINNDGYATLNNEWKANDIIELILPMDVQKISAHEMVKDDSNKISFEYGPIVYCAEEIDNKNFSDILINENLELYPQKINLLSEEIISLSGKIDNQKVILIPYYTWSNRGVGKMKVWFQKKYFY